MSSFQRLIPPLLIATLILMLTASADAAENAAAPPTPAEEQLARLQQENLALTARVRELESLSCIPTESLRQKKTQKLKEIAANVKLQRQGMSDFEGFVKWMSANL